MTERDIELAKQAGYFLYDMMETHGIRTVETDSLDEWPTLKKLIEIIRADERERIKVANAPEIERINAHLKSLEDAVKAEREACAKVCEKYAAANTSWTKAAVKDCATAIRARGNT